MSAFAPELARSEVTVPLSSFIRPHHAHYFSGRRDRPHFRHRQYSFPGIPTLLPLVRAFLDTCALTVSSSIDSQDSQDSREYRYLFTLLGSELATNAIQHSRSGEAGGSFTLVVRRSCEGLHLTCKDHGSPRGVGSPDSAGSTVPMPREPLSADPSGLKHDHESGRGLALVNALATSWGDNAQPELRKVWFFLARDLDGNPWSQA
ncbi:ATP-binding protein [Nocardiopsis sp. HNM0947]|uniref:ATP-binding protein n=1 Tax=Nocardiopsis coralli TaxID=2772213 RepID=A0ABR9PBY7_9ACTN|nr:ATP-binding protein [Nocardiopsis coralli]MBE3001352.1 ATP-binding protein [Nocardiopsis coralli]